MTISVKRLGQNDPAIGVLIAKLLDSSEGRPSTEQLQQLLADDRTWLFVASEAEEPIGYALAYTFPSLYVGGKLAYLYDIEVLAGHRRKGAGRLLMQALLAQLKADGVSELWLGTATDNAEGQALFSSTGGIRSGETFNDFTWELG